MAGQTSTGKPRKRKPKLSIVKVRPEHPTFCDDIREEFVRDGSPMQYIQHYATYARQLRGRWLCQGAEFAPECGCDGHECNCASQYREPDFYELARSIVIGNLALELNKQIAEREQSKRPRLACVDGARVPR